MRHFQRFTAAVLVFALALVVAPAFAADAPAGVVNVNTASATELERLPGVGPTVAQRIVEHREKNGAFKSVEDLMLVRGIGEKSFERIKPYVATSGTTTLKENVPSPRPARTAETGKN